MLLMEEENAEIAWARSVCVCDRSKRAAEYNSKLNSDSTTATAKGDNAYELAGSGNVSVYDSLNPIFSKNHTKA
jgi:hypothetical protein